MINKSFLLIIIIGLVLTACHGKQIVGNGQSETITKSLSNYHSLVVQGNFQVNLVNQQSKQIKITADKNLFDYISVKQDGQVLTISMHPTNVTVKAKKPITVTVPATTFKDITLNGGGSITGSNLIMNHSHINLHGSGSIVLSGKAHVRGVKNFGSGKIVVLGINSQQVLLESKSSGSITCRGQTKKLMINERGSGVINTQKLFAEHAIVNLYGSGTAKVFAKHRLKVTIDGSGTVKYFGNTKEVKTKVNGSGMVGPGKV